jgi:peptidoglycan/xylan/chitin deacetylase (PgdA/CDA1 family)
VNHPILRLLPDDAARAEIVDGRDALQALLQSPVDLFAYPNGRPGSDFAERDVALVREAGFAAAVSTASGVCTAASDRFQLPRFTPWDAAPARWLGRLVHMRATGSTHATVSTAAQSIGPGRG